MQKYIRLLSYENAEKVIIFINKNFVGDYANITVGGVCINISDENLVIFENFIKSLNVRFEICDEHPNIVHEKIFKQLKSSGIIETENDIVSILNNAQKIQQVMFYNLCCSIIDKNKIEDVVDKNRKFTLAEMQEAFIAGQDTIINDLPKDVIIGRVTFVRWFGNE